MGLAPLIDARRRQETRNGAMMEEARTSPAIDLGGARHSP